MINVDKNIEVVRMKTSLRINRCRMIGSGSRDTVVFEGRHGIPPLDRLVAVMRVPNENADIACRESKMIANIVPGHENMVQFYGCTQDEKWTYICMERYSCTLFDLVQAQTTTQSEPQVLTARGILREVSLWEPNQNNQNLQLTPTLLKLLSSIVSGLKHIHDSKCILQSVTPENILIFKSGEELCPKLSGMGIGCEGVRWKAPEMLENKEPTAAMDIYSLGCVMFYCIIPGESLYGVDDIQLTPEFMKTEKANLSKLIHLPEAHELLTWMLKPTPEHRPSARQVLAHPFFWKPEVRLSFLCAISKRLQVHDSEFSSAINATSDNFLHEQDWRIIIDNQLWNHATKSRGYTKSVEDLLRLIRNTHYCYFECPENVKMILKSEYNGLEAYFRKMFPRLLIEVYPVAMKHNQDGWFKDFL